MAYTTIAKVKQNHEKIPLQDTDLDAAITQYIADADAIIDAFLVSKYSLPITGTQPFLDYISKSFATFFTLKRVVGAQVSEEFFEWINDYWDRPMKLLEMIKECTLTLSTGEDDLEAAILCNTTDFQPIFDLGPVYDQTYHPTDTDKRYGEGYN